VEENKLEVVRGRLDEGRMIVRNVRRAAKLFLTKNVFSLILIVATLGHSGLAFPFLTKNVFSLILIVATLGHSGLAFPFLPRHVTLLNFLTIGLPALLIMLSRGRVRAPSGESFLRAVGEFVLVRGLSVGVTGLGVLMLS